MHAGPVSYHLRDETDHQSSSASPVPRAEERSGLPVAPAVKVPVDGLVPPPLTR